MRLVDRKHLWEFQIIFSKFLSKYMYFRVWGVGQTRVNVGP